MPDLWRPRSFSQWFRRLSLSSLWPRAWPFAACPNFLSSREAYFAISSGMKKKVPFTLGAVGHFGLAVRSPKRSAKWFQRALGLKKECEFDGGIAIGNDNVTI